MKPHHQDPTYLRVCHVCGETFLGTHPAPLEDGKVPSGCCGPCGRAEYSPQDELEPSRDYEDDGEAGGAGGET